MFPVTGFDHLRNIHIPFIGDDAFRVVVQFFFCGGDIGFNMLHGFRRNLQLLQHLVVPFKHLDGIPALLFFRQVMDNRFFNVREGMFHRPGEGVLRNGFPGFGGLNRGLRRFPDAGTLQGGNLNDPASQPVGKVCRIQFVAVFPDHVHHIDRDHYRNPQLRQLGGQVKIPFQVGPVNNVQDCVRTLVDQVIPGDNLFQRIGGQAVNPGQVGNRNSVVLFQFPFFFFHGDARPVSDKLVGAGQ